MYSHYTFHTFRLGIFESTLLMKHQLLAHLLKLAKIMMSNAETEKLCPFYINFLLFNLFGTVNRVSDLKMGSY